MGQHVAFSVVHLTANSALNLTLTMSTPNKAHTGINDKQERDRISTKDS
jgi:hypothetical protein